jgi:hypothetical protein
VSCLLLTGLQACHRVDEDRAPASVSDQKEAQRVLTLDPSTGGNAFKERVLAPETEQGIDNLWALFPGEPQRSFRRGREEFLSKKYKAAAQHIQKSMIYVKLQSLRAFGPTKRALLDSEAALRMLSEDVEKEKMHSLARLDGTYAATQRAMARLHLEKAKRAHAKGEPRISGVELQAARDSLGKAAVWTGDHMDPSLIDCLGRAESNGRRLMAGDRFVPALTTKTLADFGEQIGRLDRKAELEDARGLFVGETEFYFKEAQKSIEKRDMKRAAGDVRRAGACMAVEALGSSGDAEHLLAKETEALRQTADKVEDGSLTSSRKLQRCFASAQYALARVHYIKAVHYNEQHYYKKVLGALGFAVMNLEHAVAWADKDMANSSVRVVKDVKDMSTRIREGLSVKPEEISAAVSDLKTAIERQSDLSVSP